MCTDGKSVRMSPVVGEPFLPMLAKSKDVPKDTPAEWIAQPKYDGARILVHIKNGEVIEAFSRNANTVGDSLPELTRLVDDVGLLGEDGEFILDGEAIPFKDGKQQPFQAVMTRFGREDDIDEQEIDIQFKFFDLVYADFNKEHTGDLSAKDAQTRIALLMSLFGEDQQYVTPTSFGIDEAQMIKEYRKFVDDGYEGSVVKHLESTYEFNKRSSNWRKMIPEKENVELRVTAVEEGENSNSGTVGSIFIETEDGHPLGKVGEGIKGKKRTPWSDRHTVIGKIAEVSWRELSEDADGSPALRFPNMEGYREDKSTADTLEKVESL
jgi:ATP-dependent DNA ligase